MDVFQASVTIHLIDKVSGALGQIARQFTSTQTAAAALQARLNTIHSTFTSGLIMGAGGAALAAPLVFATKAAMDLQTAMGRVQIATGASQAQMSELNETLTKTANITGIFSKPKLAAFAADMYSSGITQMSQINQLLPLFAKGADLMKILSHGKIGPEEAAHTFSALAHQFGRYDAKSMAPIVEAAVAMAPALPGGLKTLRGMGGYVNVMGNRMLGVDPVQLMALEAAIAQTSGGQGTGRGGLSGAQLINALQRSMPGVFGSGLLSGKSAYSAEVLGLAKGGVSTIFKNQKFDLPTLIDKLSSFESMSGTDIAHQMLAHTSMLGKKEGEERQFLNNFLKTPNAPKAELLTRLLKSEYGSASTIAQLFGDQKFKNLLKSIEDRIKASKGIDAMQAQAMKMLEPQLMRLQTNFTTLASTIGMHMIPVLTPVVKAMGDILDKLNSFAEKHPRIVQTIVSLTALASAALLFGGAIQIARAGFMGLQLLTGPLGAGLLGVAARVAPLLPLLGSGLGGAAMVALKFIGPLGLAITAVALVIANWDKIMGFVHEHQRFFISIAAQVVRATDALGKALSGLLKWLASVVSGIGGLVGSIPGMAGLGDKIKKAVDGAMKVDDVTAKRNEEYLKSKGFGGLVSGIKGAPGHTINQTNNFSVNQVPGHNHEECYKTITKKLAKDVGHAASASSGNSTGRSINQGGATRP